MRQKVATTFVLVACLLLLSVSTTEAASKKAVVARLSLTIKQTPSDTSTLVTLYGAMKPAKANVLVTIQSLHAGRWINSKLTARTTDVGTWSIQQNLASNIAKMWYRASATIGKRKTLSPVRSILLTKIPIGTLVIDQSGPGGRILGADISRWQHKGTTPIDFGKMYSTGTRFVMIKASDTHDAADADATAYFATDRQEAQAAGLYTGFYHYAYLPDTTDNAAIVADANAQAAKTIWRLASVGGYTAKDLPYALDLENNCVRYLSSGKCAKFASAANTTLFALTWLKAMQAKTGRAPILYSYPTFLESSIKRNVDFRNFPLWIAHYSVDPKNPLANPGQRTFGCYTTPWTQSDCTAQWSLWQFTSCGIGSKYGVLSSRLDLNVFRGGSDAFLALTKGIWTPQLGDFLPINEPDSTNVSQLVSANTDLPVTMRVDVIRQNLSPVVTGGVTATIVPTLANPPLSSIAITQNITRIASGTWTLSLTGLPAGTWNATIDFKDPTGVHAPSNTQITFVLSQGINPIPTPKPTALPTITPTLSPSPTVSPTLSPSPTVSPSPSPSPTLSPTPTPTPTPKPTPKPTQKAVDYCLAQFPY
jgi:lysozyme